MSGACLDCGAAVAGDVPRCATHRRPAFYDGRMPEESIVARAAEDDEHESPAPHTFTRDPASVSARVRAAISERWMTAAEITAAIGADKDAVRSALWKAVRIGLASSSKIPGRPAVFRARRNAGAM